MTTKRLRAPAGASGFSHAGTEYVVDRGYLDVPEHVVAVAKPFGYVVAADGEGPVTGETDVAKWTRGQCLEYVEDHDLVAKKGSGLDELRKLVWSHIAAHADDE